jgi:histidine triad (HIT) family protein
MELVAKMMKEENVDCIFCKIVNGEVPTELIAENEHAIAFLDLYPKAPVHILVVPKTHSENILELNDSSSLTGVFKLIREVTAAKSDGQFKLQFNTGEREGQSVFHTHAHILSQQSK